MRGCVGAEIQEEERLRAKGQTGSGASLLAVVCVSGGGMEEERGTHICVLWQVQVPLRRDPIRLGLLVPIHSRILSKLPPPNIPCD